MDEKEMTAFWDERIEEWTIYFTSDCMCVICTIRSLLIRSSYQQIFRSVSAEIDSRKEGVYVTSE